VSLRIGLVGARGHVGSELIRLIAGHPEFELAFVASAERGGQPPARPEAATAGDMAYVSFGPQEAASAAADALVLALPNDKAADFVAAVDAVAPGRVVLDLSADYRFDDRWYYGLPELTRAKAAGKTRISNPGCYASAMQLAIAPMAGLLEGPVQCFGVSGYSGAGTTPSDKNDPDKLRDNLMPYSLVGHIHEREVTRQLGQPVEFQPPVAPQFPGPPRTLHPQPSPPPPRDEVFARYRDAYRNEPLVKVLDGAPWVSQIAGRHHVEIGGFTLSADGRRLVVVATIDNLLKGAATQALQNLNLAFGLPELTGISA